MERTKRVNVNIDYITHMNAKIMAATKETTMDKYLSSMIAEQVALDVKDVKLKVKEMKDG